MTATDHPAMELTRNPVDGTWGFICREHGVHRHGLVERHALNVEAKHIREAHPDANPALNLSAMAADVLHIRRLSSEGEVWFQRWDAVRTAWETLTGLKGMAAVDYASNIAERELTAYVPTF